MNKREAKEFVELFFEKIKIALEKGECSQILWFWQLWSAWEGPAPRPEPKNRWENTDHCKAGGHV